VNKYYYATESTLNDYVFKKNNAKYDNLCNRVSQIFTSYYRKSFFQSNQTNTEVIFQFTPSSIWSQLVS